MMCSLENCRSKRAAPQPTEQQFLAIRDAGYTSVVNLAPHSAQNALNDEAALLERLGLRYTNIPVDFGHPTEEDFLLFIEAMSNSTVEKTWVHCAANMRVSAFMYRYRRDVLKEDAKQAKTNLDSIWEPNGDWRQFLTL